MIHPALQSLRASLPVIEQCVYLQTGSLGPLSRPVLQAIRAAEELAACSGPAAPDGLAPLVQANDAARAALARLLHTPVTEAVAHTRHAGGTSLIDGAQAVGQIPVDVRSINADYYIGSCHKWLLAPSGLGYIHVRSDRLAAFNPNWTPATTTVQPTAATLGEVGTTNLALRAGARIALEQIEAIGMATIAEHCRAITAHLRAGLRRLRPVSLLGPDDPARTTGLVGFTVAGWSDNDCRALVDRLYRDQRILIKHQPEHSGLRVSIAAFNTLDECDRLLAALGQALGNDANAI